MRNNCVSATDATSECTTGPPYLSATPETIKLHLPDLEADPLRFVEVVLGLEWIKDTPTQTFIIDFLTQLKSARSSLILPIRARPPQPSVIYYLCHNWLQKFAQTGILSSSGGYKEEEEEGTSNM